MPRNKLEGIINDFEINDFANFFRLKTQAHGNFRLSNEKLSQYNSSEFSKLIKLGQIEFSATEKLVVVGAEVERDLSERSGKKNQYEKAKEILKGLAVDAGIFIFYDASGNFRFSLVYPEAVGRRREWSNFRRFTYFVSKELKNKTFLSRIGDGDFSSLIKIKDAFSVEKVTEDFYLEYRKLFEGLLSELSKNHTFKNEASRNKISPENFAKKLLGQIVFLYFVQKKGWLGVPSGGKWGEGNKNFMGDLFREAIKKNANFYNDYLEKLFYNVLNNPRRNSVDPSFSKDFNCRIPFLNGGLFEAEYKWEDSLIYIDNNIFKAIFDVFERYNFTIEEESPDDKEIAVDPEMLGKVFENLLPENLRKGKGTFYTPREIVYYMCRESLVNYLVSNHSNITEENVRNYIFYSESFENFRKQKGESFSPGQWKELDDLLKNIKVCDPACGSGAFLVGMLNLIIKLRIYLQTTPDHHLIKQKTEYELKKETIQNCIYGVDIDPGAIEIAKLRLWLSLVVDYNVEDIEPLPNLDYRLMCGNSLLEEFEGVKFYNGDNGEHQATLLVDSQKQEKVAELEKKVKQYFDIHDDAEKKAKRKEINDIKDWLIRSALEKRKRDLAAQRKTEELKANMLDQRSRERYLSSWSDKFLSEGKIQEVLDDLHNPKTSKPFFIWKLEFIDVFEDKKGFDVVIANPPYVNVEEISEEIKKSIDLFQFAYQKYDLYVLFYEKALSLLKDNGVLNFISSNKFLSQGYGLLLRKYLLKLEINIIINFNFNIFDSAIVRTCIVQVTKKEPNKNRIRVIDIKTEKDKYKFLEEDYVYLEQDIFNKTEENNFRINLTEGKINILNKIKSKCLQVLDICSVNYGLRPVPKEGGRNKAKFIKNSNPDGGYKVYFEGKDMGAWSIKENSFVDYNSEEMYNPMFKELFENPKIFGLCTLSDIDKLRFNYDDTGAYCNHSVAILTPWYLFQNVKYKTVQRNITKEKIETSKEYSLKYLQAILNSKMIKFYVNELMYDGTHFYPDHIKALPIKIASKLKQKLFIKTVDKILAITKTADYLEDKKRRDKVDEYEKQIDKMVYKLYNLTSEEIKIVEAK